MTNTYVLDLEIMDPILQQSDWEATDKIRISVCVVYDYNANRFRIFGPRDVDKLRMMLMMDCKVITFNGNKFDLPVIYGMANREYPAGIQSYDILAEVWKTVGLDPTIFTPEHKGYGLNAIAKATLGKQKKMDGASAPLVWKQGDFWKVIDYCIDDVALTKELYDFILKYGYVRVKRTGRIMENIILNQQTYEEVIQNANIRT